jgi:PUA-domain protein
MGSFLGPKLSKRRALRRKDARKIKGEAEALLGPIESNMVDQAEIEDYARVYLLDGTIQLAYREDTLFPALTNPLIVRLPSIVVDMGAVPYVCKGADVMAPGIKEVRGEFEVGELIVVRDVNHGKALAIGKALVRSDEMRGMGKGKAVKNLHHVGDKLWQVLG